MTDIDYKSELPPITWDHIRAEIPKEFFLWLFSQSVVDDDSER